MDVAAYLSRQLLSHLRVVIGQEHGLVAVESWQELLATVRERMIDVVVADPLVTGRVEVEELQEIVRQYPSVPVVVYTVLSPLTLRGVVSLARVGVEHVVLNRFDDEPRRFRELLERVPAHALGDRMLEELAEPLSRVPAMVSRAIQQLYRYPMRFHGMGDLAAAAGMNTRTLYRHLEPAGFSAPRMLVVSARLLRAYAYLRDPGRAIKDVAEKAGYHSPWQLAQQMRELTGMTPRRARQVLDAEEFVRRVASQLRGTQPATEVEE